MGTPSSGLLHICLTATLKVCINGKSGVPQGSNLGPLFFIVFINDIFLYPILEGISVFADDATFHQSGKSVSDVKAQLQIGADSSQAWCKNE